MSKKQRRQQGAKRLAQRQEALLLARESAALREWKARNELKREFVALLDR